MMMTACAHMAHVWAKIFINLLILTKITDLLYKYYIYHFASLLYHLILHIDNILRHIHVQGSLI